MANNTVGIEIDIDSRGAIRGLRQLGTAGRRAGDEIEQGANNASSGLSDLFSTTNLVKGGIIALGYATVKLTKDFALMGLSAKRDAETAQVQFEVLLGSVEAAKDRYAELVDYASKTPFQIGSIARASKVLQSLTGDVLATGEGLSLVGDVAANTGVAFDDIAITIGRLYAGLRSGEAMTDEINKLGDLGINAKDTKKRVQELIKAGKGFEAWDLVEERLKKVEGAADKLSKTMAGGESTLIDNFAQLAGEVTEAVGALDLYRNALGIANTTVKEGLEAAKIQNLLKKETSELTKTELETLIKYKTETEKTTKVVDSHKKVVEEDTKSVEKKVGALDFLWTMTLFTIGATEDAAEAVDKLTGKTKEDTTALAANVKELKNLLKVKKDKIAADKDAAAAKAKEEEDAKIAAENAKKKKEADEKALKSTEDNNKKIIELGVDLASAKANEHDQELIRIGQEYEARKESAEAIKEIFGENSEFYKNTMAEIDEQRKVAEDKALEDHKRRTKEKEKIDSDATKRKEREIREAAVKEELMYADVAHSSLSILQTMFGENKEMSLAMAAINTATSITKTFAQLGWPAGVPAALAAAAAGAAQIKAINRQKFADGGYVSGPGTNRSDSIPASLSNGEFVVNAQATSDNREILEAINAGQSTGSSVHITVNAGVGTDGNELAQVIVNEIRRAEMLGLEPSVI